MADKRLEDELSALKEAMGRLRDQLAEMGDVLVAKGKEKGRTTRSKVEAGLESGFEKLRHEWAETAEKGEQLFKEAQEKVGENPLLSLALAFGAGFILGKLSERK
jgi:ElaB/YqjD/DUF883 family membrane-anchored ribosome-binding protein